ncbi:NTP transferase domain-containing protein [Candidatus Woesearchaeota archaeon]|nr:NTP transferase domain-containing protein [Candidatus Woesearchaeota archaeon]
MKAVILCAGKSTRTYPLTVNKPKPLLKVANICILERNMNELHKLVDEFILVVGFKAEMIKNHVGKEFKGKKVRYVEQQKQLGTGHAVLLTEKLIKDRFIVIMGDDLYSGKDIEKCTKHRNCLLVKEIDDVRSYGVWKVKGKRVHCMTEKPTKKAKGLANIGAYVLSKEVFGYLKKIKKGPGGEYYLPWAVADMAKKEEVRYEKSTDFWFPLPYSWSLLDANEGTLKRFKRSIIRGEVEKGATIKGNVVIGKGTIIKSGSYIEGPVVIGQDCKIGPNCYIRPHTSLGDRCKVGNAVEIKNSILYENVSVGHLSYVGDSIIGENTNFGAGTITANLRHDNKNIVTMLHGKKIDTGRRKLGAIIGENVHTGVKTTIYPGRKIWPGVDTMPLQVVDKDMVR